MPDPVPPAMEWQRVKPSMLSQYSASRSAQCMGVETCRGIFIVRSLNSFGYKARNTLEG